jgi:hypothetical protein
MSDKQGNMHKFSRVNLLFVKKNGGLASFSTMWAKFGFLS